jgi:hypothetical protein
MFETERRRRRYDNADDDVDDDDDDDDDVDDDDDDAVDDDAPGGGAEAAEAFGRGADGQAVQAFANDRTDQYNRITDHDSCRKDKTRELVVHSLMVRSLQVVALKLLKRSDAEQMGKLFKLLRKSSKVVEWFLLSMIFPNELRCESTRQLLKAGGSCLNPSPLPPHGRSCQDMVHVDTLGGCVYSR